VTGRRLGARVVAVVALASLASRALPQEEPTFPAAIDLVRIDVVVLDHKGQPVTGLTAADFEVAEGGKAHEIVSFEPIVVHAPPAPVPEAIAPPRISEPVAASPEENRYFLIFFDDVHVSPAMSQRVRTQLVPFLEKETHDGDWVTIVAPLQGLRFTARTAYERSQIPLVLHGIKGQLVRPFKGDPSDYAAMRTVEYGSPGGSAPYGQNSTTPNINNAEEIYAVAKRRVRQSLEPLSEAVTSMADFRGRKALILYSEGFIRSPTMPDYDRAIELARRTHVTVYFIDPRGLRSGIAEADSPDPARGPDPLTQLDTEGGGSAYLAVATGGRTSISNDLTALFHEAAVESSAYYLLGFLPSPGATGERKVKVRVRQDGLTVHSADHYFVGEPESKAKPEAPAIRAVGLVSDATGVPLRVGTLFLDGPVKGDPSTTMAIEIGAVAGGSGERHADLLIEARPLRGGVAVRDSAELTLPATDRAVVLTRELHLAAGVWQARAVVRIQGTEQLGAVLHTFEVPGAAGLRVSSPILSDGLESTRPPKLRLQLDRRFASGGTLYCQYGVFGASVDPTSGRSRVSGSFSISRGGQVVQQVAATPIEATGDGQVLRLFALPLAGFAPGDYSLELRVTDDVNHQSREVREAFAVVP
jgi:VWFA-related protein